MKIGIDIDDVLYKTSDMIREECPKLLETLGYHNQKLNMSHFDWQSMTGATPDDCRWIANHLSWTSRKYINKDAITQIKRLVKTYPDTKLYIVTRRNMATTKPIANLLRRLYRMRFEKIICVSAKERKVDYCAEHSLDYLLDDEERNVKQMLDNPKCKAILVSTPDIEHNKRFAKTYNEDLILTSWDNLCDIIAQSQKKSKITA